MSFVNGSAPSLSFVEELHFLLDQFLVRLDIAPTHELSPPADTQEYNNFCVSDQAVFEHALEPASLSERVTKRPIGSRSNRNLRQPIPFRRICLRDSCLEPFNAEATDIDLACAVNG